MITHWYDNGALLEAQHDIDLHNDTIMLACMNDSYTPDRSADIYMDDIITYEPTEIGYERKQLTINDPEIVIETPPEEHYISWTIPTENQILRWTVPEGVSVEVSWIVIFKDTTDDSTSPLLFYIDGRNPTTGLTQTFTYETFEWRADPLGLTRRHI